MPSDLFLNDDNTVALVGNELHLVRAEGSSLTPVVVKGRIRLLHRVLVDKPPAIPKAVLDAISAAVSGTKTTPAVALKRPFELGPEATMLEHDPYAGVFTGGARANPVFGKLRKATPPYDLYEMLEMLRLAVLDLHDRIGR